MDDTTSGSSSTMVFYALHYIQHVRQNDQTPKSDHRNHQTIQRHSQPAKRHRHQHKRNQQTPLGTNPNTKTTKTTSQTASSPSRKKESRRDKADGKIQDKNERQEVHIQQQRIQHARPGYKQS